MTTKPTALDIAKAASAHFGLPVMEILSIMKTPMHPGTLRDEFAGKAMQGLVDSSQYQCAGGVGEPANLRGLAEDAYALADAMLKARAA